MNDGTLKSFEVAIKGFNIGLSVNESLGVFYCYQYPNLSVF